MKTSPTDERLGGIEYSVQMQRTVWLNDLTPRLQAFLKSPILISSSEALTQALINFQLTQILAELQREEHADVEQDLFARLARQMKQESLYDEIRRLAGAADLGLRETTERVARLVAGRNRVVAVVVFGLLPLLGLTARKVTVTMLGDAKRETALREEFDAALRWFDNLVSGTKEEST
jgi:hypothetical protein